MNGNMSQELPSTTAFPSMFCVLLLFPWQWKAARSGWRRSSLGLQRAPAGGAHPCATEDEQKPRALLQNAVTLCPSCTCPSHKASNPECQPSMGCMGDLQCPWGTHSQASGGAQRCFLTWRTCETGSTLGMKMPCTSLSFHWEPQAKVLVGHQHWHQQVPAPNLIILLTSSPLASWEEQFTSALMQTGRPL